MIGSQLLSMSRRKFYRLWTMYKQLSLLTFFELTCCNFPRHSDLSFNLQLTWECLTIQNQMAVKMIQYLIKPACSLQTTLTSLRAQGILFMLFQTPNHVFPCIFMILESFPYVVATLYQLSQSGPKKVHH